MIVIDGPAALDGELKVQGAKNSTLPLLAATVLCKGQTVLHNCPHLSDVDTAVRILEHLGSRCRWEGGSLVVDHAMTCCQVPPELMREMRSSIVFLGAIVSRCGEAELCFPGGCELGPRPIDLHIGALRKLGVEIEESGGCLHCRAPQGIQGTYISLSFPSVGATENTMMCAVTAKGQTVIENAAREPEIEDLANMLNSMGARISGAGTAEIIIDGVELSSLHPCEHSTVGDRIEAGTFLVGGALTGGPVTVRGIDPSFLRMALMKLSAMGCSVDVGDDSITVSRKGPLLPTDIQTLPHPGFPTDLQAQFMLLASVASGNSVITENVFENRFMFAAEIGRMGAEITIEDHHAVVEGVPSLQGASVKATDLRCGAALVLAGIFAEGETQVHNIYHIDRGYEDYVGKLTGLGANVRRVPDEDDIDW